MNSLVKKILLAGLLVAGGSPLFAVAPGDQGIGLMLGNPSGFSGKMWFSKEVALDGAIGADQGDFDIHATLLYHDYEIPKKLHWIPGNANFTMPVYAGVGPRLLFADKTEFGARFPVGVSLFPNDTKMEFFGELAPVWRFTPSMGVDFDFAIGARYYFEAIRPRTN